MAWPFPAWWMDKEPWSDGDLHACEGTTGCGMDYSEDDNDKSTKRLITEGL